MLQHDDDNSTGSGNPPDRKENIHWMSADTPRTDIFGMREGRVVLKNIRPARKAPATALPSFPRCGPLAEAGAGTGMASVVQRSAPQRRHRCLFASWSARQMPHGRSFATTASSWVCTTTGRSWRDTRYGGLATMNTVSRPMAASMRAANWLRVLNSPSGRRRESQIICGEPWRVR